MHAGSLWDSQPTPYSRLRKFGEPAQRTRPCIEGGKRNDATRLQAPVSQCHQTHATHDCDSVTKDISLRGQNRVGEVGLCKLSGRAAPQAPSSIYRTTPSGPPSYLIHEMGRDDDNAARARVLEHLPRGAARVRVHARRGLVEEDDLRAADWNASGQAGGVPVRRRRRQTPVGPTATH